MSYANYRSRKLPGFIIYVVDLMRFSHLGGNLVASDLRSRFRQSYLGVLWAILQPLGYSLIIAWAWGAIFKVEGYWEFAVYVYSGMLVWEYFLNTVNGSLQGLIGAAGYLRQARIPLFIFQVRVPLSGLVTLLFGFVGLVIMMAALQMLPPIGPHILLIPVSIFLLLAFMTPVSVIFSVLGAQLRDLQHIMALVLSALFFLSPVMIMRAALDEGQLAILKFVNPIVPLLDLFRDPLLNGVMWREQSLMTVAIWTLGLWIAAFAVSVRAGRKIVFAL